MKVNETNQNKKEKNPKVSVLIPNYNYGRFLGEAIESVLCQTFNDFEIIIVDNNSTDNSDEVAQKYLSDSRIRYYKNPVNIGSIPNFNKCLEYATGEYIKFLMSDDKFHSQLLEKFTAIMDQYPQVALVTSYRECFDLKSKTLKTPYDGLVKGEKVIYESLTAGKGNWIGEPTTVMFRKSSLSVGNFNPAYSCLVDLNLWLRILTTGDCYFVPESLSCFRIHGNQLSNKNNFYNRFDEYFFYKTAKINNEYHIDHLNLNIEHIIKAKAITCVKAMYKSIPELYKKNSRLILKKGLRVALTEHVLLASLVQFLGQHSGISGML